ncbi:MAG: hypothetical protein ACOX5S_03040 [Patescibacteria group bacterium]|jgi:hypothetical protein
MTKKQLMWLAITLGVIAFVAIGATIYFAWPRSVSPVAVSSAEQVSTATLLPTVPTLVEATVTPMVSTEPASAAVAETASACCETVFVDLGTAPEGVWSNASAVLVPEGWCVVLRRDQRWQQSREEVELRQTWQEGATEDYLLLCNPDPGSRYYSLEGEFGGRPGGHEGFWNDQAKAIWVFPDPKVASCRQGTVVLYENDQEPRGWSFSIGTDGKVSFAPAAVPSPQPEAVVTLPLQQPQNTPAPSQAQAPTELPSQPTQPASKLAGKEFSLAEDLRQRSDVQILSDRPDWDGRGNGLVSLIRIPEGSQAEFLFQRWGPPGVWNQVEAEKLVTLGQGVYDLTSWEGGIFNDALQRVVIERGTVVLCENSDGSGIVITFNADR